MPQLDRLLAALTAQGADAVELTEGGVAALVAGGVRRPLTRQALSGPQLVSVVREVAPPDAAARLDASLPAQFSYAAAEGRFLVRVVRIDERWSATVAAEQDAASAPSIAPGAAAAVVGNDAARASMDRLLRTLVERGGSDLHLRVGEPPVIRASGELERLDEPPMHAADLEAMLLGIMPEKNRTEFADRSDTDYAYEIEGVARFRANALRDRKGPAGVFRVIPATVVSVEQMGITQEVQNLCYLTKGLVLVTGPTGSGKSTTLCSLIDLVNRSRSDHVITIEDPIEFVHPNKKCIITQRQVGVHTSSFKSALRAALREDPDIILVGELRDLETVSIAIETAETGHLVFGTLHTTTAAGTIDRIIDQFPADRQEQIRVMLAESLKGVISQTLCKKIGGGRVAAREILLTIPAVSNLVREGKTFQIPSVMQTSKRLGMCTLNDALIDLVDNKLVEPKEAYMKCVEKQTFAATLKSRGHDVSFLEGDSAAQGAAPAGGAPANGAASGGTATKGAAPGRPVAGAGGARR